MICKPNLSWRVFAGVVFQAFNVIASRFQLLSVLNSPLTQTEVYGQEHVQQQELNTQSTVRTAVTMVIRCLVKAGEIARSMGPGTGFHRRAPKVR